MSTLQLLINAMKEKALEAVRSGNRSSLTQITHDYLKTIRSLDKKTRKAYWGLEFFLEITDWYLKLKEDDSEISSDLPMTIADKVNSEEIKALTPNFPSQLEELKTFAQNDDTSLPVQLFESLSEICSISGSIQKGASTSNTPPAFKKASLILLELVIGFIFYGILGGLAYLFYSGKAGSLVNGVMSIMSVLPPWLGKGLMYGFIILFGVIVFSGVHFAICGIGKNHFAMGTRGYNLKLFLAILLAMPAIAVFTSPFFNVTQLALLPFVFFTGRGLRRKISGELVIIEAVK